MIKLAHPNIVKCFEYFVHEHKLCIVIEFVQGGDLRTYLDQNKNPLPEETVVRFMKQLVSALKHCHENGIIHRDLKPENILLTANLQVKLSDFGVSFIVDSNITQAQTIAGTVVYMSPEILSNQKYSFPTDIWSLGCIFYELMAHCPPFGTKHVSGWN